MDLNIVYEDGDVIVVNKPAGLVVHPEDENDRQETLAGLLLKRYPALKNVGDPARDSLRPGIVHRLDKETSGLMVVAKNQETFEYLKKQFQNRLVEKKYLVLVIGHLKNKRGVIEKELGRYGIKQRVKIPKTKIDEFKKAITEYGALKEYQDFSLVEAMPRTGRMHQIRVHFAALGHPVAGDKLYGFKKQPVPPGLNRQFLHASYLQFSPKPGKILAFRCDLPQDLKIVLRKLKIKN